MELPISEHLLLLKVLSEDAFDFKALFRERALQFFPSEKGLIYDTRKKWHLRVFKLKALLETLFPGSMITVTLMHDIVDF